MHIHLPAARQRWRVFASAAGIIAVAVLALGARQLIQSSDPPDDDPPGQSVLLRQLNAYKNRNYPPLATQINPAASLEAMLAPGEDLHRWSMTQGAVLEGIVVNVKTPPLQSVIGFTRGDTHLELALDAQAPPAERVIVEVTPDWREKLKTVTDWTTSGLRRELVGRRVRVTGWLFDDVSHVSEAENTNPGNPKDRRATVWEVHPVTAIEMLPAEPVLAGAHGTETEMSSPKR